MWGNLRKGMRRVAAPVYKAWAQWTSNQNIAMNKVDYPARIAPHPFVGGNLSCSLLRAPMTWQASQMGTHVAPTSLEGRGEVVVPAIVPVFHLSLKRRLVNESMGRGSGTRGAWAAQMWKCTNAEKRVNVGRGARFPVAYSSAESRRSCRAEDKPWVEEAREQRVSNVIYQVCI